MAAPSLTYTLTNGSTADASQVMQNFNDLLNGITDGTKDLTIAALTCAGNASFQGNVTLGNGSVDDVTFSGSLASSIPIKTNNSFDFGSATLGLAGVYLGAPSSRTTRITANQSLSGSNTLVLPNGNGSVGQKMVTDGSGNLSFANSGFQLDNLGLAASVGTNALTVALKDASGADASSSSPVYITFRNATSATGTPVTRAVTGALSMTVTAGATLGHADAVDQYVWVYALDNAGTVELAVSGVKLFNDGSIAGTSGVGSGSDDGSTLYSTTTRSNVAIRLIGRLKSNQATAGTWATAISEVTIDPRPVYASTDPITYTPTLNSTTNVSSRVGYWHRDGATAFYEVRVAWNGNGAAGTFTVALDTGQTINTSQIPSTTDLMIGSATWFDASVSYKLASVMYNNTTSIKIVTDGSAAIFDNSNTANGDVITVRFSVPIVGWSAFGPV